MNATFEITTENGIVVMNQLSNALLEEIDDTISIHADNGFMISIPKSAIETELHEDDQDIYITDEGLTIRVDLA